jgi:hypothetical protein
MEPYSIDAEIKKLKQSPIFNLSLASKELFHSNLLAWVFEENKGLTKEYFEALLDVELGNILKVHRERRNIDLTIDFTHGRLMIENKVKSIPNESQLKDYDAKLGDNDYLLLLSLFGNEGIEGYKIISYEEILTFLKNCKNASCSAYVEGIYEDYMNLIQSLIRLTVEWGKMDMFDFHSKYNRGEQNMYSKLLAIRLHDLFHKVKYNKLKHLLFDSLRSKLAPPHRKHLIHFDYFSKGTGASSLSYVLKRVFSAVENKGKEIKLKCD